ncbi:MAG: hypothetical protein AB7O45_11920 [Alphaproteobacteria bacterium]
MTGITLGLPREANDFYRDPPIATEKLLQVEAFVGRGLDPAAGTGTIPRVFRERGRDFHGTDLVERPSGGLVLPGVDFLEPGAIEAQSFFPVDYVASNPPYKLADRFVARAMALPGLYKAAFLLPLTFLEGTRRKREIYDRLPLARVWVFSFRVSMPPGNVAVEAEGGKRAYAWFVFEKSWRGPPHVGWLE